MSLTLIRFTCSYLNRWLSPYRLVGPNLIYIYTDDDNDVGENQE